MIERQATNERLVIDLIYELIDAHLDTAGLAANLRDDMRWSAHLVYLQALQRVGREVLAEMTSAPEMYVARRGCDGQASSRVQHRPGGRGATTEEHMTEPGEAHNSESGGRTDICLSAVTKRFPDGTKAVHEVTLEIDSGEFMVLVGPSGCGKSTLLRMIAGLEEVTSGTIHIGGQDATRAEPRDRDIAMIFQSYALYPHMTVRENCAFPLRQQRVPRAEIARRVEEVAATLGLQALMERRPAQLSGGQRQRAAMGRAIIREPRAFLMDEPLSNLDAKLRVAMRAALAQLHARLGITTVYVTHDQVEAMTLGRRVAVMRDGVLQQCDRPQRLFDEPANLFVAAFIGSPPMNLVEADLEGDRVGWAGHSWPAGPRRPVGADRRVIVGLRPTGLAIADRATDPESPRIRVSPTVVEELGAERNVMFELDAPRVVTDATRAAAEDAQDDAAGLLSAGHRAVFVAALRGRESIAVGQPVELAVDVRDLRFFDPATGEALQPMQVPVPAGQRQ